MGKRISFIVHCVIGIVAGIVLFAALLLAYLSIREYRPSEIETLSVKGGEKGSLETGVPFQILAWNIGYAGLSASEDFFMDGGKKIRPDSKALVEENLAGILRYITETNPDIILFQEVDIDSRRSWHYNELDFLSANTAYSTAFAYNFLCAFVPFPIPPIGKVESGLLTLNKFKADDATRISLPVPFKWPLRIANLKRCLLVERIPVAGRDLILVNLHLEAYESGAGRAKQTEMLIDFLNAEYAQGNYCIAGGDFNQNFPGIDQSKYALLNTDYFIPSSLSEDILPSGWRFVSDDETPTCRLADKPYKDSLQNQYYVIDGFIISPNVDLISIKTCDLGFRYSDHNPIEIRLVLK